MKKIIIRISIVLLLLVIVGVIAVGLSVDGLVKRGVETVGPMLTQVQVKLDSVSLSLLSGAGKMKGLFVGNPSGFKSPSAIQVGLASLALQPKSIFGDKVIINSINVQAPEITFETDLKGNNLSKILSNLQEATGGTDHAKGQPSNAKSNRKLQVDDFLITGAKVHVSVTTLGGKSVTVPLPEIHLTSLGQGPEGITAAELTKLVLQEIEKAASQVATSAVADLGKDAAGLTKGLGSGATGAVDKLKGLGGLLKKN
jgi:hypothetical protein